MFFCETFSVRKSLQLPYTGPHPVICRDKKTLAITAYSQETKVSIDRVKPAYVMSEDVQPSTRPKGDTSPRPKRDIKSPPKYVTHSGRHVHFKVP